MKTILVSILSLSLLVVNASAFAMNCPGSEKGVFTYDGSLPDGWTSNDQISSGEHNFLQAIWKPSADDANVGTVYCAYSGSIMLEAGSIPLPDGENWSASSVKGAFHCSKSVEGCEFSESDQ